ncbi:MAG: WG repeat-containing protein, partial [Clostridia bacterium]|nr:WG repeat-containing protein [Clostridia bacterium]
EKGERVLALPEGTVYAGPFGDGLAPVSDGITFRYCDAKGRIVAGAEFDYAGAFCRGAAAVCVGGRWGLVDTRMNSLTPLEYDEILTDENGFCFEYGTAVALKGGKWFFLDSAGTEKGPGYEGAELPASDTGPIAVKVGSLWGFADKDGVIVIEPHYEGAGSFCHGMAPVMKDGLWGFIDENGNPRTEFEYDSAGVFSAGGGSVVRKGNLLFLLMLAKFG